VSSGAVLVSSGPFWLVLVSSGAVLVWFLWVLESSGRFWWILVGLLWVLLSSGRFLVGSGEFW
jgi:hypothetical protein